MVSVKLSYQMLQLCFKLHAIGITSRAEVRHHDISDFHRGTLQQTCFGLVSRKEA